MTEPSHDDAALRAALSELPDETMPADVVARLEAVIAAQARERQVIVRDLDPQDARPRHRISYRDGDDVTHRPELEDHAESPD